MSLMMLSFLAAAQAARDDQSKPATLSTDFVLKASTQALAKAVLPPEFAAKVKGHKLSRPHLHWVEGYPARFWGEATLDEPGFCQRATYYVPMPQAQKGTLTPGTPIVSTEIKMAADCSTATEPFVHLNRISPQKAVGLLRWFAEAHRDAAGTGKLKVDVECRSELKPNPCAKGARRVLAELPLEGVSIVERTGGRVYDDDWRMSINPPNAPGRYWQVSIFNWPADRPRVRISWADIPPY